MNVSFKMEVICLGLASGIGLSYSASSFYTRNKVREYLINPTNEDKYGIKIGIGRMIPNIHGVNNNKLVSYTAGYVDSSKKYTYGYKWRKVGEYAKIVNNFDLVRSNGSSSTISTNTNTFCFSSQNCIIEAKCEIDEYHPLRMRFLHVYTSIFGDKFTFWKHIFDERILKLVFETKITKRVKYVIPDNTKLIVVDNIIVEYTKNGIEHVLNLKTNYPLFIFTASLVVFGLFIINLYFEYELRESEKLT